MALSYETKFNDLRSLQLDFQRQIDRANQTIAELEIKKKSELELARVDKNAGKRESAISHIKQKQAAEKEIANTIIRIQPLQRHITDISNTISAVIKRNTLKKTKTLAKGGRLTRRRRARTRRSH